MIVILFYSGYWYGIRIPLATRSDDGKLRKIYRTYDVEGVFKSIEKIEKKPLWLKILLNIYDISEEYFIFNYATYNTGRGKRIWYMLLFLCWTGVQWGIKSMILYGIHFIGWQQFLIHPVGWLIMILYGGNWITLVWGIRLKYLLIKYHKIYYTQKNINYLKAQVS